MAVLTAWGRRVAALPPRARLALAAAIVLSVVAVLLLVVPGGDGDTSGGDGAAGDGASAGDDGAVAPGHGNTSTTLATDGIEVAAPEGWQAIPVPDVGFGIAVPPGWEATVLSDQGLAALAGADPAVEDFVANAHAAAASGGLVYAAGQDGDGQVSDVLVRAAPSTGVTDVAGLEAYGRDLAARAGRSDPAVEVVQGAARPTVRMRFTVGGDGAAATGTETLVLADDGVVWSVVVTSDDEAAHDDLAARITSTLTFPPAD